MKPPVHAVRDLGQAVKRLRLQRKMTQQELADASGLDIRYIGSIERGQRNPTRNSVGVWDENLRFAAEGKTLIYWLGKPI